MAAILPGFFSHAACIALALIETNFNPSLNEIALQADNAENSPNE